MNCAQFAEIVQSNIARVMVGKEAVVELLLVALLCDGHVLLEDVPGIGKTTLAKALARSLDGSFARIQFTPDLLPSDVTGINYYNQKTQEFEFRPGPVFSQILLADEINRATPRTQSSLLEAMQERQVTVDGQTYRLSPPFMVIATQNPIELEGTFPLPEAQLDRFMLQIALGYPSLEEEREILLRHGRQDPMAGLEPVATMEQVRQLQEEVRGVHVAEDLLHYILQVVRRTREHEAVRLGVSPRGSLALFRASQALAALRGRPYVIPSDVQHLCRPLLTHRIHISPQIRLRGRTPAQIVDEIAETVPVPVVQ
ncbi:MoxR family ATPase [Litorilinea aerophila]|uniref:MoxR family ATPase n=1 Tax=Litorilinea aerophila TaxID=1204385 RepID=A0A540VJ12_9CHLR|nr:MoxR family ATPase [Litorilinea aerophila]MCC9075625.1 MoxR family ATPase [Litorilinea aerophila]GIV79167.1 MAG: ATPase [Litorilinea sp.]